MQNYDLIRKAPDQVTKIDIFNKNLSDLLQENIPENDLLYILLESIKTFQNRDYKKCVDEILKIQMELSGIKRENDWIISMLVRLCYKAMKISTFRIF